VTITKTTATVLLFSTTTITTTITTTTTWLCNGKLSLLDVSNRSSLLVPREGWALAVGCRIVVIIATEEVVVGVYDTAAVVVVAWLFNKIIRVVLMPLAHRARNTGWLLSSSRIFIAAELESAHQHLLLLLRTPQQLLIIADCLLCRGHRWELLVTVVVVDVVV